MTTRFPNGITTAKKDSLFGSFIMPDPTKASLYNEDFYYFNSADWTVSTTGASTQALGSADFGQLDLVTGANANDQIYDFKVGPGMRFQSGKQLWFDCAFRTNLVADNLVQIGLSVGGAASPLLATDGVFFSQNAPFAEMDLIFRASSSQTVVGKVADIANDEVLRLGFYYDGKGKVTAYLNGNAVLSTTNLANLPIATMSPHFGLTTTSAAVREMGVDFITVALER